MDDFNLMILARSIHVVGVVLWIGGVAFVTTILIPSLINTADTKKRLEIFENLEGRFAFQAKIITLITGVTGFAMLGYLNAWVRYEQLAFWWIHLMTFIWIIFTIVLFVLEPLILHRLFLEQATKNSDNTFKWLHRMHKVLLFLSLVAVLGAVAGSHGYQF